MSRPASPKMEVGVAHDEKIIEESKVTVTAGSATLAAALENSRPNPWGKGYIHMYAVCALIFLTSTMNGKDLDKPWPEL